MPDTPVLPLTLADRLRQDTRALHRQAERSGVMAALLHGRLERQAYVALLHNLHAIYDTLETVADVQPAALRRAAVLAADLDDLQGPQWRQQLLLVPATLAYVQRLQQQPAPLLLAHVYVRYLGDLHGGQLLKQRVAALLGDAGLRFYDFGEQHQVLALIAGLRQRLAARPATGPEADAIVAEACWAFAQHIRLFDALQPSC